MRRPAATARLFAHERSTQDGAIPDRERHLPHLLARLLEEGERADLRWLTSQVAEAEIAAWFAASGGRALSRRSRAFWRLLLAVEPSPPPAAASELWPLA